MKKKSFAWLSLSVLTVCFFLVVAIRPTVITITKLIREIKEKETASLLLDKKIDSLVAAQKVYARNSQRLVMLDQAFPEKSEFPKLVEFLDSAAQSSQTELITISIEKINLNLAPSANKAKSPADHQTINFSTSIKGNYLNLKNFISLLETSRRLIQIEVTGISEAKKTNQEETSSPLQLNIAGAAFFKNE